MNFIVQENLWGEGNKLFEALKKLGQDPTLVKVIPFSGMTEPDCSDLPNPKMAFGSTSLMRMAIKQKWSPGVYTNTFFDYRDWYIFWRDFLLNTSHVIGSIGTLREEDIPWPEFFVRPCGDFKQFAGRVMRRMNWADFQEVVMTLDSENELNQDTHIVISPVQTIFEESRFFIVGCNEVSSCVFRQGDMIVKNNLIKPSVDSVRLVQRAIGKWAPHRNFVLDIAETPQGPRIVEANCINCAGFYQCDIEAVVTKILIEERVI